MRLRSGTMTSGSAAPHPAHCQPIPSVVTSSAQDTVGLDPVSHVGSPAASVRGVDAFPQYWAHHHPGDPIGQFPLAAWGVYGLQQQIPASNPWVANPLYAPHHPRPMPSTVAPGVSNGVSMVGMPVASAAAPPPHHTLFGQPLSPDGAHVSLPMGASVDPVLSPPHSPSLSSPAPSVSHAFGHEGFAVQLASVVRLQQEQLAQQSALVQRLMDRLGEGSTPQQASAQGSAHQQLQELRLQTSYDQAAAACPKLKRMEPQCIVQFARMAKKHFARYNIGDRPILERLSTILVDKALEWLDNKHLLQSTGEEPEWETFDDFLAVLKADHPEPVASFTVLQQLMTPKVRQTGRSVRVYHGELVKLFATEHHSFDQRFQVAYFLLGLDTDIQSQLMRDYPQSLAEAFKAAAALEASIKPPSARQPPKHHSEEQKQLHRQQQELRQRRLDYSDKIKHAGQRTEGVRFDTAGLAPGSSLPAQPSSSGSGSLGSKPQGAPPPRPHRTGSSGKQPRAYSIFTSAEGSTLVLDADGKYAEGETYLVSEADLQNMKALALEEPESGLTVHQ